MLVYIPFANFKKSVRCLDNSLLLRTINSVTDIICYNARLHVGNNISNEIINNPDRTLWKNSELYLMFYLEYLHLEHVKRFNKEHYMFYAYKIIRTRSHCFKNDLFFLNSAFCLESQKRLLKRSKKHYKKFFS